MLGIERRIAIEAAEHPIAHGEGVQYHMPLSIATLRSALQQADQKTAAFFERHPFAYEETLDHLLIHHLESAMAGISQTDFMTRFTGRRGQIYVQTGQHIEAIDLFIVVRTQSCLPKIIMLQSKRLFPEPKAKAPASSKTPIQGVTSAGMRAELDAFITQEQLRPQHDFLPKSSYKKVGLGSEQWKAIADINFASVIAGYTDAIHYLLYNPLNASKLKLPAAPSGTTLGLRIISQTDLKNAANPKGRVAAKSLSNVFAQRRTQFDQFITSASSCHHGIPPPGATGKSPIQLVLPGLQYDFDEILVSRAAQDDRGRNREKGRAVLSEFARRTDSIVIDLRTTPSITFDLAAGE